MGRPNRTQLSHRTFGTALEPTVRCGPTQNVELDLVGSNAVDAAMCDAVQRDAVRGTSGAEVRCIQATCISDRLEGW